MFIDKNTKTNQKRQENSKKGQNKFQGVSAGGGRVFRSSGYRLHCLRATASPLLHPLTHKPQDKKKTRLPSLFKVQELPFFLDSPLPPVYLVKVSIKAPSFSWVSVNSLSGVESYTMPPPACRENTPSLQRQERMVMQKSRSPLF